MADTSTARRTAPRNGPAAAAATVRLRALADRLGQATAERNWGALAALDRELAELLAQLQAELTARGGALGTDERAALGLLRHAHQQARARCAEATEQLGTRLAEMQQNKDGWLAYAASSDWNGSDA